jgi:hypothetical protein
MMSSRNADAVGEPTVVALIPAAGWRVGWRSDDGQEWTQPLVGWGLRDDGSVVPLDTDCNGLVEALTEVGGTWRVYHPDATESERIAPVTKKQEDSQ